MKPCLTLVFALLWAVQAFGQVNSNLPIIQNVGVIPVQWGEGEEANSRSFRDLIDDEFPKAVRASRKYRVINDDLVAARWRNKSDRDALVQSQELQGFFSLQVQVKDDVVTFISRLLSVDMKTYLLESNAINTADLQLASRGQVIGIMENLVFKMLNRIPVDAHVTSLQGRYITISGGELRGIQVGDKVDVVRTFILSRHPANGSWMKMKTSKLGQATVVEVKKFTSVAKLENMIAEDAIRVGDGMNIPRIKPRSRFRNADLGKPRGSERINEPVVVNPMYPGDTKVKPVLPQKDKSAPTVSQSVQPANPTQPAPATPTVPGNAAPQPGYDTPGTDDLDELVDMLVDYGKGHVGMRLWNYGGGASASASFPLILVNHGRMTLGKAMTPDIGLEVTGNANFGQTSNGSFFGFGGGGRIFMHRPLEKGRQWKAGAEGQFNSLAVTDQTYGGADIVTGGGFIGVEGPFMLSNRLINYYAEFALFPINLGQLGVAGRKRTIQSSFNFRMTLAGQYVLSPEEEAAGEMAWGGQVEIENYSYSLDGNKKISGSSFNILGSAAWRF